MHEWSTSLQCLYIYILNSFVEQHDWLDCYHIFDELNVKNKRWLNYVDQDFWQNFQDSIVLLLKLIGKYSANHEYQVEFEFLPIMLMVRKHLKSWSEGGRMQYREHCASANWSLYGVQEAIPLFWSNLLV